MAENNYTPGDQPSKKYWKSIGELNNDPKLQENSGREFIDEVKGEFDPDVNLSGLSRRKFLALLGASAALTAAGCSDYQDKGEIVPYNKKPEEIIPGRANYYASTCSACSNACGILIKTREGRPIKVDGNPDHPVNQGKICVKGQAQVLNLYDPARLTEPFINQAANKLSITWENADSGIISSLKKITGKEIAVITSTVVSPSFKKVLQEFTTAYPDTKIYSYEQFDDSVKRNAWLKSFGSSEITAPAWDKAKIILALEGDFLGVEGNVVEQTLSFSKNRDTAKLNEYSRLYAAESNLSLTGMNADHRLRVKPEYQYDFVLALLNEVSKIGGVEGIARYSAYYSSADLSAFAAAHKLDLKLLKLLAADLAKNKGKCLVFAGRVLDEKTHVVVNIMNSLLGTEVFAERPSYVEYYEPSGLESMKSLTQRINNSLVGAVIHIDTNPAYTLPSELKYSELLRKVPLTIALSEFENETTQACTYVLPLNHSFESWGDARARSDVYSTMQPVIAPLYNTRQKEAIMLVWASGTALTYTPDLYRSYIWRRWDSEVYPQLNTSASFIHFWNAALHDGVVRAKWSAVKLGAAVTDALINAGPDKYDPNDYSILITQSHALGDGKFANNGWLQELPHPVSKVTWDNYAAISNATAKELGIKTNDLIKIDAGNKSIVLPALIQPGLADRFIAVEAGYGRRIGPVVAIEVGHDISPLLSSGGNTGFYIKDIKISKTGEVYKLASSQDHHTYDEPLTKDLHKKREIIREGTVSEFSRKPAFLHEERKPAAENMYAEVEYKDVKWAMAIDLNKCTGCGSCSVACSVENNIPVVGKDQVLLSREMQWMRIDRYYSGTPEDPAVSMQPMLCQHCDHAPCENVCPVVATNHSIDGLNQMVYNRCVGTRYCSNNCPYKVRRFNFYNFRDHFHDGHYTQPVMQLAANPEVTIRSRGVMEKCTFCVHRIADARAEATREGKVFNGEGLTSACQDACPANAIVFGNVNNTDSEVYRLRQHKLGYSVLDELNIQPNVTYLAKLRNTHSEEV